MRVIDLHCDLLGYLASSPKHTIFDPVVRASLPQLLKGQVVLQTMAVWSVTGKKSVKLASKQFSLFAALPYTHNHEFVLWDGRWKTLPKRAAGKVFIIPAVENASGFCDEKEKLDLAFKRLDRFLLQGPILYVSLTWHHENRFGGGNLSKVGLKKDGKALLEYLDEKIVAIDLSHTSDRLAEDILNHIDKKKLSLIPIASHSNFRAVVNHPRNLPGEFVKEIARRGGIIGLNFVKPFIGSKLQDFRFHIEYIRTLDLLDHLCLGADFFYDKDASIISSIYPLFHKKFGNASCYPQLFTFLRKTCTEKELQKIAYGNFHSFLKRYSIPGAPRDSSR